MESAEGEGISYLRAKAGHPAGASSCTPCSPGSYSGATGNCVQARACSSMKYCFSKGLHRVGGGSENLKDL
jgi:hypothetical protein